MKYKIFQKILFSVLIFTYAYATINFSRNLFMKSFRLKTPLTVKILVVICILLSLLGALWNVFNVYEYFYIDTLKTVCYLLAIFLSLLLTVFCISFFFSKYKIKDKTLLCYTGFLKTKLDLIGLSIVHHVNKSEKTFLIFEDGKAVAILLESKDLDCFVDEIRTFIPLVELRRTEDLK